MSEKSEMAEMLQSNGIRYAGDCADDSAADWLEHDFSVQSAESWCEIGCWDAATAYRFVLAGLTPEQVQEATQRLIDACDDPAETYTDGDPIYAACNNDLNVDVIIAACQS